MLPVASQHGPASFFGAGALTPALFVSQVRNDDGILGVDANPPLGDSSGIAVSATST